MRKRFLSFMGISVLAAAVVGGLLIGSAAAERVKIGNIILTANGSFKPTKLSKKKMTPIQLKASGHVKTDDGSVPPRANILTIDFDRNGTLTTKGIRRCDPKKLINTSPRAARRKCKKAIVGKGTTKALVAFPEDEPFVAKGPLTIFNGKPKGKGKRKKPTIVFHTRASVPLPTTFITQATVVKSPLKGMGKRVKIRVPTIAGGNGTLVDFKATISRKPATGKRYILARCKNGRLKAQGEIRWIGLTDRPPPTVKKASVSIVRKCKKKR